MPMAGSMIVVDTNAGESALYEALVRRFDGSTVQRRRLDVGDVMLVAEAGTVYVERKTWLDLASSLIDRRYVEQKARLRSLVAQGGGDPLRLPRRSSRPHQWIPRGRPLGGPGFGDAPLHAPE